MSPFSKLKNKDKIKEKEEGRRSMLKAKRILERSEEIASVINVIKSLIELVYELLKKVNFNIATVLKGGKSLLLASN